MSTITRPTRQIYSVNLQDIDGSPIGVSVDAFGRLRTGSPTLVGGHKQVDILPYSILMSNDIAGGATATYQSVSASVRMVTTASATSEIVRKSRRMYAYETGKSQSSIITFRFENSGTNGTVQRAGFCNNDTGIYFEITNQTPAIALLNNGSISSRVDQLQWNIDKLNGDGPSGIVLNPYAVQIFAISFEWLGVGNLVAGFFINNRFTPIHVFAHANSQVVGAAYWETPNLPLYWYAKGHVSGACAINAICGAVISEGGTQLPGLNRADYNTASVSVATATTRELLSIRLRSNGTVDGNLSLTSATVFPLAISGLATTNDPGILILGYNPTFTGAGTWQDPIGLEGNLSHVQICKTARLVTSPGHVMGAAPMSTAAQQGAERFDSVLALGMAPSLVNAYGVSDIISLMLVNTSGSAMSVRGTLTWREVS